MKLYSFWRSSCSWRVRTVLQLKLVPFELVAVNITPGTSEQLASDYAAVNPLHQVPCLEWTEGGTTRRLTQSVAICEWLEQRFPTPALFPQEPLARARVRQAVEIVNSGIQPLQNLRMLETLRQLGGEPAVQAFINDVMTRGLRALEAQAAAHGGRYSVADELTLADVFLVPQLTNARRFGIDFTPYPKLLAIEARCTKLAAFARAHPEAQPDAVRG